MALRHLNICLKKKKNKTKQTVTISNISWSYHDHDHEEAKQNKSKKETHHPSLLINLLYLNQKKEKGLDREVIIGA